MERFYPPGPASVPENLARVTPVYRQRAWLAMGGLALFVALYCFIAGWFTLTAYRLIGGIFTGSGNVLAGIVVGLCAAFLAVFMLKALFFVKHGGKIDDLEITPEQQPRLFEFLHRLADEAGAPRPHRVFLSPTVNAAVFYDLSLFNLIRPSKKNLEIGLGLVNVLSIGEFKAVCAHEFGHFAQKSMAVGRWVYIAQQIASHIVAKRDALDNFLQGLCRVDLRIAWVGWLLSIIVWSIRSLMESVFSLVVLAQRALSRQMEMQADLVAVSLTGSDALIHALHRLQAADEAWERSLDFVGSQLARGNATRDVFTIQTRVVEYMGAILGKPDYGKTPVLPVENPERHRLFKVDLAQPPRMWSTHPLNHEREDNAKESYIPAPLDNRSAWEIFDNAEEIRERITAKLTENCEAAPIAMEVTLKALDEEFSREFFNPSYRGVYLGRSVVRNAASAEDLYEKTAGMAASDLDILYPESLADALEQLKNLEKEKYLLESLRDGTFSAPGGVIRHRGKELRHGEIPAEIDLLKKEIGGLQEKIGKHDRLCRSVHRAAAAKLGFGWEPYLVGLGKVLHYADHSEANIRDVSGFLGNTVAVVTAGGRVSSRGFKRVMAAAGDVYKELKQVFDQSGLLCLDNSLARRLETGSWSEFLGEFKLSAPNKENINDWMSVVDSWINHAAGALGELRRCALEELLASESKVSRCVKEDIVPEQAPHPPVVPDGYATLQPGRERALQKRLGWWGRFQVADGIVPTIARLAVAGSIVTAVLAMGGKVGTATITIYNGLAREVKVNIGGSKVKVPPFSSADLQLSPGRQYRVESKGTGGHPIETFDAEVKGSFSHYVYNIANASPLVEWTAVYGKAFRPPDRMLNAPRWMTTKADVLFSEPPAQIETNGGGGTRRVLEGLGGESPYRQLDLVEDKKAQSALIAAHARWDGAHSQYVMQWLSLARTLGDFPGILAGRLGENPLEIVSLRLEQDTASPGDRGKVCANQLELARKYPENGDFLYLADRCIAEKPEREKAFLEGYRAMPRNGWLAFAAGYTLAGKAQWQEALPALETASRKVPETASEVIVDIARIRRLLAKDCRANMSDLEGKSHRLGFLQSLESGKGLDKTPLKAYSELARGDLEQAVKTVKGSPAEARMLRLAAASEGADDRLVKRALALDSDQGIDDGTIWVSMALAVRSNLSPAPYEKVLREQYSPDEINAVTGFMRRCRDNDIRAAEDALTGMSLEMRGQAYSIGVVLLGKKAPGEWRDGARYLLFASERPYL